MQIEQDVHIERSPEAVFDALTDPELLPAWQKGTVEVRRDGDGPLTLGERVHEVHAAFGRRLASTFEVTALARGSAFAMRAIDSKLPLDGRWDLAPEGSGTRLHFTATGPLPRWLKPVVALQFRGHHRRLKKLLETP